MSAPDGNLTGMDLLKRPYELVLLDSFALGKTTAEAARTAKVSEATARRFRNTNGEAIKDLQAKTVEASVKKLKDLLPEALKRLEEAVKAPIGTLDAMRVVRTVVDCYAVLSKRDLETEVKEMKRQLNDLLHPPEPPKGK